MPHYIHDENNNRIEGLSKEEIYALLAEAIEEGRLPSVDTPTAFVTKLKDYLSGTANQVAFITQAQYNQLEATGQLAANTYYFIIDDTTEEDIEEAIATISEHVDALEEFRQRLEPIIGETQTGIALGKRGKHLTLMGNSLWFSTSINSTKRIALQDDVDNLKEDVQDGTITAKQAENATKTNFTNENWTMVQLSNGQTTINVGVNGWKKTLQMIIRGSQFTFKNLGFVSFPDYEQDATFTSSVMDTSKFYRLVVTATPAQGAEIQLIIKLYGINADLSGDWSLVTTPIYLYYREIK